MNFDMKSGGSESADVVISRQLLATIVLSQLNVVREGVIGRGVGCVNAEKFRNGCKDKMQSSSVRTDQLQRFQGCIMRRRELDVRYCLRLIAATPRRYVTE